VKDLIEKLTAPDGCPWDRKQTPESLSIYLIEETYELVDAIRRNEQEDIEEEMGDVLFQLLFLLHLYRMDLQKIVDRNLEKMIRRHPHVFGDESLETSEAVRKRWQQIKQAEKQGKAENGLFDSIPKGVPALIRAYRVSDRAAKAGFDWETLPDVMKKVEEEWREFLAEVHHCPETQAAGADDRQRLSMEFGDILFTLVNVARFAGIHPETALAESTRKFEQRFRMMETAVNRENGSLQALSAEQWQQLWNRAKQQMLDPESGTP
jgi:MazG family protein